MEGYIVAFCTAGSEPEAEKIAGKLVEEKLAACASVVPSVLSIYVWEGKLCREAEAFLIIKSTAALQGRLIERILELHSYDCPEVITLPVAGGSEKYLAWVGASVI